MEANTAESATESKSGEPRPLPPDFVKRVATKIIVTAERERNPEMAVEKVASLIHRNLLPPERHEMFFRVVEELLSSEETERFAGVCWASLVLDQGNHPEYEYFVSALLNKMVDEHFSITHPLHEIESRHKKFSHYAWHMGSVFITMVASNAELYDVISDLFSSIIRKEMALEANQRENEEIRRISLVATVKEQQTASKKLFDDTVEYIHERGQFKSNSLAQKNPNEYIAALAERMRGTRRYVIQDILDRQRQQRQQQAEKEIGERLATAEDIILSQEPFRKAVNLYWIERRYNFKYIAVEKVRVTVKILGILIGLGYFLGGYLNLLGMHWIEGVLVAITMYGFSWVIASRKVFTRFFPEDLNDELEVMLGSFTPTLRRMSLTQMEHFLIRQVRHPGNQHFLHIIPDFFKYVLSVMPDRNEMIVSSAELVDLLETLGLEVRRIQREFSGGAR